MRGAIGRTHAAQLAQIVAVQREYMGEAVKILRLHLASAIAGDIDAMAQRHRLRAPIGRAGGAIV